ncbi:cryptochrome/photolyase family protein [Gellertiella hungarica]|uniref:Deoxyribodipyrimidine photolyase-related protein n=1 Tax=Gellertiella hungarica TaxID=1572859 RepID=A0A7W6J7K8_9HYPH|nr:cryptochrome/photolyase family protein [Gellertiella hungarica]MBB4065358.1 deoxyribodipyrimidine photolyase-related protein [Gellertiella hungarica]
MTGTLRLVLGDQLARSMTSLTDLDRERDVVLMAEVMDEASYVPHHKQKIAFLFSAMRHFAQALEADGVRLRYVRLDDPANTQSLTGEVERALRDFGLSEICVTEPGEWRVREMLLGWRERLGLPVHVLDDDRFFCSRAEFAAWARGKRQYRMEFFYRNMRRKTGLLMDGTEPAGGQWNFDHDNRHPLPDRMFLPKRLRFEPDEITRDVLGLVRDRFGGNFGDLEPFGWAVTRESALLALDHFIDACLPAFGTYQDAMQTGEDFLYHGLVSPYLNAGLLTAREVCERAEEAFRAGRAPINAVEGFIRQILGWREYVRGIYWERMPGYRETNTLEATRPLPALYWTGETPMHCLSECVRTTRQHAYAHHIQRLMVLGNFALLAGLAPREVQDWYLLVYADAYEWVELPNVHGMVLHADGGLMASKPYAASGAYIDRMSDYCGTCRFSPKKRTGKDACPFNFLYWNFLIEHRGRFAGKNRMAMMFKNLDRLSEGEQKAIREEAKAFLDDLKPYG